jgi:hypothetical protein
MPVSTMLDVEGKHVATRDLPKELSMSHRLATDE